MQTAAAVAGTLSKSQTHVGGEQNDRGIHIRTIYVVRGRPSEVEG